MECLADPQAGAALGLTDATVQALADTYRTGLPDRNFGDLDLDWGLGMCTDPAWFGAPSGTKVAGHTAYGCGLVVARPPGGTGRLLPFQQRGSAGQRGEPVGEQDRQGALP
ncbi:hypothetical protein ACQ4WX_38750 [Streptomyces lasalocidi]